MPTYSILKSIPTYKVDKNLIENIESFFQDEVYKILNLKVKEVASDSYLSIKLFDTFGVETIHSIKAYKYQFFRNDMKGLVIEYKNNIQEDCEIEVILRFGKEKATSQLEIALNLENARDKATAIEHGLFTSMNENKTSNWLLYPPDIFNGIAALVGVIFLVLAFNRPEKQLKFLYGGIVVGLAMYYIIFRYLQSYCTFKTKRQDSFDDIYKWFIYGLCGFILFSIILTSLRKSILGI